MNRATAPANGTRSDAPTAPDALGAQAGRRRMNRVMTAILVVYLCVVVAIMVMRQVAPTPDLFLIFASIVAVIWWRGMFRRVSAAPTTPGG